MFSLKISILGQLGVLPAKWEKTHPGHSSAIMQNSHGNWLHHRPDICHRTEKNSWLFINWVKVKSFCIAPS